MIYCHLSQLRNIREIENGSLKKRLIPVFEALGRVLLFKDPPNLTMVQPSGWKSRRPAWMNKELLAKLKHKKRSYKQWNQSRISKEEDRDTV